ncbi:MAG TPA: 2OG-Fe(II) oxygenase [Kofleriaceae bacterium]|nr:2OG-Fe(II) oxygenase [Kofleriaceae bacterium]
MWRVPTALETEPFRHLIIDDACERPDDLLAIVDDEGVEPYEGDIFRFEATTPESRGLHSIREQFAAELAPALSRLTGRTVRRVDMRAYAYRPGHYLLPHTDHREGLERVLAYAYYLPTPEPPKGGELELFACTLADDELTSTISAKVIEPRANRLVIFEVGDTSLHQVREVLAGMRLSLAGWFYA